MNTHPQEIDAQQKMKIHQEESFRLEVKQQLEQLHKKKSTRVWEALNSSVGIWFLSTCVVGLITFGYSVYQENQQKAQRAAQASMELARNNAALVTVLLPYLASDEKKKWSMALEVVKYLKLNGQLPGELEYALEGIVYDADTSKISREERDKIERATAIIDLPKRVAVTNNMPARAYIQISSNVQRPLAKQLEQLLNDAGFITPGIENVEGKADIPAIMEVRYYNELEKEEAQRLISILKQNRPAWQIKDSPVKVSGDARPRHYEIWFGK